MKDDFYKIGNLIESKVQVGTYIIKHEYGEKRIYVVDNTRFVNNELYARVHDLEFAEYDQLLRSYLPSKDIYAKMLNRTYANGRIYYEIWTESQVKNEYPELFI